MNDRFATILLSAAVAASCSAGWCATPPPPAAQTPLAPLAPSPDAPLEPSLRNEVDRALELADVWLAAPVPDPQPKPAPGSSGSAQKQSADEVFALQGLSRQAKALKLVGAQRVRQGTGWWEDPRPADTPGRLSDADATILAVSVLRKL